MLQYGPILAVLKKKNKQTNKRIRIFHTIGKLACRSILTTEVALLSILTIQLLVVC